MLHTKNFFANFCLYLGVHIFQFSANHAGNETIFRCVFDVVCKNHGTVAHNGYTVCNAEYFIHLMRNEEERNTLFAQLVNGVHQDVSFTIR